MSSGVGAGVARAPNSATLVEDERKGGEEKMGADGAQAVHPVLVVDLGSGLCKVGLAAVAV